MDTREGEAGDGPRGGRASSPRPERVTIKDVARAAGVSAATVSKALNDSAEISEATKQVVARTARRLGYRPNAIARSLKARQSLSIGVITDDDEGFFSTSMMRGLEQIASARGVNVFLCNSLGEMRIERQHLLALLDKQVDGLIILGSVVKERAGPATDIGDVPLVFLYCHTSSVAAPCVLPDDKAGARILVEHLLGLGRRRIAMINGPATWEASALRLEGYREALVEHGLRYDPVLVGHSRSDWYQGTGYRLMNEILDSGQPDAVFCASDYLASGALSALQQRGISVPDDVSLAGFDDRPFAKFLPIPLTTMALPQEAMGRLAGELLFEMIENSPAPPTLHRVGPELVVRASCGGDPAYRLDAE